MSTTRTPSVDPRKTLRDMLLAVKKAPPERKAVLEEALARAAEKCGMTVTELEEYAFGPRQYSFNDLAGCVEQRRSRATGTMVGLYQAEQAGLDPDAGKWVTVCEDHSTCVNHPTLSMARHHLPDPTGWCDDCREKMAANAPETPIN